MSMAQRSAEHWAAQWVDSLAAVRAVQTVVQ